MYLFIVFIVTMVESGGDEQENKLKRGQNSTQTHATTHVKTQDRFSNFMREK